MRQSRRDPLLLVLILLAVALVPWFGLGAGDAAESWLIQVGLDALMGWTGYRLFTTSASRRFWLAVTITSVCCFAGDLYQAVRVFVLGDSAGTSVVQTVLVVGGVVVTVLAMLFHPLGGSGRQRLRLWLDTATVLVAVAVFLWYFTLAGALTSGNATEGVAGAVTSAIMMLVAFGLLKLVLSGTAPFTMTAGVLGSVGFAATAVGASLTWGSDGTRFLAQLLPNILVVLCLRVQLAYGSPMSGVSSRHGSSRLPYLAVIATQVLLVAVLAQGGPSMRVWGITAGTGVIVTLVLSRQLVAFRDNERLLARLDSTMSEVASQREWFRSLVQHSSDVTLVLGADGALRYASPAVSLVLGVSAESLVGDQLCTLAHTDDVQIFRDFLANLSARPGTDDDTQLRIRHADGTYRWLHIVGTDLRDNPSVNGTVLNARDVTEAQVLQDELRHAATHDPLTSLANRAALDEKLASLPPHSAVSLLLVDLDGFKPINDRYGHQAGDHVLISVARRLGELAGPSGLAVRLGGDEFVLLLPSVSLAAAEALAELVVESMGAPIPVAGRRLTIGASIGVAAGRPRDADRILRDADAAMYRTKARRHAARTATGALGRTASVE